MTGMGTYRLLGRSGLRVSPLALGAMTFGTAWGWGADEQEARRIFDTYLDAGGNMVDTANAYTDGQSEEYLGRFLTGRRESVVVASKYTASRNPADPNAGGTHRKSLVGSIEATLRRLGTDYLDLLYVHAWDPHTPAEEVIRALDDLVRAGKVLYLGISDAPAWQVSRMQTIAELRGWAPLVALQVEYNLIERTVERDLLPMAQELGLGVVPWGPLGGGVLTGKYTRADLGGPGSDRPGGTRKDYAVANQLLTERGLDIADVVSAVADEVGATPAQIALRWTLEHPAVTSPLIGARTPNQLRQNLAALDVDLDTAQLDRLDAASQVPLGFPHEFLTRPMVHGVVHGTTTVRPHPAGRW